MARDSQWEPKKQSDTEEKCLNPWFPVQFVIITQRQHLLFSITEKCSLEGQLEVWSTNTCSKQNKFNVGSVCSGSSPSRMAIHAHCEEFFGYVQSNSSLLLFCCSQRQQLIVIPDVWVVRVINPLYQYYLVTSWSCITLASTYKWF